jgi:hypothetical protein
MGIFDDFLKAINGNDPDAMGRAAAQAAKYAQFALDPDYQKLFSDAVFPWCQQIAARVPAAWFHPRVVRRRCDMPTRNGQCKARAATMCAVCRRDVCLSHCYVNVEAAVICEACVAEVRKHVTPTVNSAPGPEEQQEPAKRVVATRADIDRAWRILGLDELATDAEIAAAYKKLLKKWHPDKASAADKAKYEAKFKAVRWAHDTIGASRKD